MCSSDLPATWRAGNASCVPCAPSCGRGAEAGLLGAFRSGLLGGVLQAAGDLDLLDDAVELAVDVVFLDLALIAQACEDKKITGRKRRTVLSWGASRTFSMSGSGKDVLHAWRMWSRNSRSRGSTGGDSAQEPARADDPQSPNQASAGDQRMCHCSPSRPLGVKFVILCCIT